MHAISHTAWNGGDGSFGHEQSLSPAEKWERLTLANNFIFYKIMRHHPDACRELLELLLGIRIERLSLAAEDTIATDYGAKGVRLDVFVQDSSRIFDIELQVADTRELAERSRYYQGVMDVDTLKSGELYRALKDSHVIFLCMEDVIGAGLPVYTFESRCRERTDIVLGDRAYKHFFIAPACATMLEDAEKRAFFTLLSAGRAESGFTERLQAYINDARHNTQWRMQYMTWERQQAYAFESGQERGMKLGLQQGAAQTRFETARNALSMGLTVAQAAQISGLTAAEVQRCAASAASASAAPRPPLAT